MAVNVRQEALIRKNDLIREGLRGLLTRMSVYHQSEKKNIIMISSGRTGSTFLMESMGAEPGLRFVNEPFTKKHISKTDLKIFPKFRDIPTGGKYYSLNPEERQGVNRFLENFKYVRRAGPYNPLKSNFHFKSDRLIVKMLTMNLVLDHFLDQVDKYQFMWLVRHPMPTIISSLPMKLRRETIDLKSYVEEESFREAYLTDAQADFLIRTHESGAEHEVWAAEWALDHVVPLRMYKGENHNDMFLISYEQLVVNPELVIGRMAKELQLDRPDLILKELRVPSASTRSDKMAEQKNFDPNNKIKAWRKKTTPEMEGDIFDIIEFFGIDLYARGRDVLNEEYLLAE